MTNAKFWPPQGASLPLVIAACVWLVASLPKFVGSEGMLVRPLGNQTS